MRQHANRIDVSVGCRVLHNCLTGCSRFDLKGLFRVCRRLLAWRHVLNSSIGPTGRCHKILFAGKRRARDNTSREYEDMRNQTSNLDGQFKPCFEKGLRLRRIEETVIALIG
ncbi:hypothetical protein CDL15_Pgr017049 [Punica granatum]|uniref:Uncharacterized protein n=1 Tax=Punica granatum TaxID=22663 RepID=A0A218WYQ6_PUNGR|nr:hypothetical protein CDL15_Pgr017049 [Punica granatum]